MIREIGTILGNKLFRTKIRLQSRVQGSRISEELYEHLNVSGWEGHNTHRQEKSKIIIFDAVITQ